MSRGKIDKQREHQANERTFLAWLRTSIALIGFGFAIARFGLFLRQLRVAVAQNSAGASSGFSAVFVHPDASSECCEDFVLRSPAGGELRTDRFEQAQQLEPLPPNF